MAGTLAFDFKDAFIAALQADSTLAPMMIDPAHPLEVWYGDLSSAGEFRPRLLIMVGEIQWYDERAIALGGLRRDEYFQVLVTIESHVPGDTQKEANDRVEALMQAVEHILKDPRASGLPLAYSELKPQMLAEGPDGNDGRGAVLVLAVDCSARKSL